MQMVLLSLHWKVKFQEKEKSTSVILIHAFHYNHAAICAESLIFLLSFVLDLVCPRIHPDHLKSLYVYTTQITMDMWGILQHSMSAQMLSCALKTH